MKTRSVSKSGYFNPRALIGFGFGVLGLLLGLVAFIALPKHSAFARPSPCTPVVYEESSGPSCSVLVSMESHNEGTTTQCTIYYTIGTSVPPDPTHSSSVYTGPIVVANGTQLHFKAFGHKLFAIPEDSAITSYYVNNFCGCCF
jgi:chitobiase/beta-hexosaminidase-like protein